MYFFRLNSNQNIGGRTMLLSFQTALIPNNQQVTA